MARDDTTALIARRLDAMNGHDVAAEISVYADDCIVDSPSAGGVVKGRAAIGDVNRAWISGFPDVAFTTEDLLIDGDRIAWIVTAEGTHSGGFMGLPPTGRPFNLPMVVVSTISGGRVVRQHADNSVMDSHLAGRVEGPSAIAHLYEMWFTAFPDSRLASEEVIVDGARVAEIATLSGTDSGGFLGLPATRRPFQLPSVWFYTLTNLQFAYVRPIYDFTGMLVQIGLLKPRPA
jgi:predicted ester cyclase